MNSVAFDLGGSGGKVFLGRFDGDTLQTECIHRFPNSPVAIHDGLYWDVIDIYRQLCTGLGKAGATAGFTSLGIDTFSNDFALVDRRGELLSQVRCYRDSRTARYREQIYRRISPQRLYQLTGNQNAPFNTLMHLAAMREAGQGYLLEGAGRLLFLPDLLIHFLTGEAVTEYTIASVSQMFSFERGDWAPEILEAFDIPRHLFAPLTMPGSRVGGPKNEVADTLGAGDFQVISVCQHDTASAFLSACGPEGSAILSAGTWSLLGCEVASPLITREGCRHNVANEGGYPGHHRLLRNVMGSWILQEIREELAAGGEDYTYAQLETAAGEAAPFAHLIDVDDERFFAPGGMVEKVRGYCIEKSGKAPESLGALVRCVYESLAMKYRYTLDILESITGRPFPAVHVVGGGSRDRLLCRMTAACCGRPVLAGPADATALGNILVQLISVGELAGLAEGRELLRRSYPFMEYEPDAVEEWEEQYRHFREKILSREGEE